MSDDKGYFVLCDPKDAEKGGIFGRPGEFYRYGKAWWDNSMDWDYHIESVEESRRIRKCHRGNLKIVVGSPAAIADFVWTWFSECLITQHVAEKFKENGFTGYHLDLVEHVKCRRKSKRTSKVPSLYEISVYGDGGAPHPASGSIPITDADEYGERRFSAYKNGLLVNDRTWDGSDFFTLESFRYHTIITERVKDLIVRERFKNCGLIPVENLVWPSFIRTPEEELLRKRLDEKLKAAGLETEAERAARRLKQLLGPAQTIVNPKPPVMSKEERKELIKQIKRNLREQESGDDSWLYSSRTDDNE